MRSAGNGSPEAAFKVSFKLCAILQQEHDSNQVLSLTQDEKEALIGELGRFSHRLGDICQRHKLVDAIEDACNALNPPVVGGNSR